MDWDPSLAVGVDEIDAEHRQIVRRVSALVAAAADDLRPEEVRSALRILHAFLQDHWEDEERWMADTGYPGLSEHRRQHQALLTRVASARQLAIAQPSRLAAVGADVARAVEDHLRLEDVKLARFLTARANLRLLATSGSGRVALTPLPGEVPPARRAPTPVPGTLRPAAPARTPVPDGDGGGDGER